MYGRCAKNPLCSNALTYHCSGTRYESQFISTSRTPLWPVAFAIRSFRPTFSILTIDPSMVHGWMHRLDTPGHRQANINTREPRANSNSTNSNEVVFDAYLPPHALESIVFPEEVVHRFPKVRYTPSPTPQRLFLFTVNHDRDAFSN